MTGIYLYLYLYLDLGGGGGLLLWREEGLRVKSPLIPIWLGWLLSDWERKWLVICYRGRKGLSLCAPGVGGGQRGWERVDCRQEKKELSAWSLLGCSQLRLKTLRHPGWGWPEPSPLGAFTSQDAQVRLNPEGGGGPVGWVPQKGREGKAEQERCSVPQLVEGPLTLFLNQYTQTSQVNLTFLGLSFSIKYE